MNAQSVRLDYRYDVSDKTKLLARSCIISTTIDVIYREFQLKVINIFLNLNYKLYKLKVITSPLCSSYDLENETIEFFFENVQ